MSRWVAGLTDLQGVPIGPIVKAYERKVSIPLNGARTASVRLHLDDPLVDEIFSRDGDVRLKVYQDSTLRFQGELIGAEEDTEGDDNNPPSVACNFIDAAWNLQKRWVGDGPYGYIAYDTPASTIITSIITAVNARKDTGIRLGTIDTLYETSVGTDSPSFYKPAAEALTNLQESKVPYPVETPLDYVAVDTFARSGFVDGSSDIATPPNTWDSNGPADWATTTTAVTWPALGQAYRTSAANEDEWFISNAPAVGPLVAGGWWISDYRARSTFPLYFLFYVRLSGETAATVQSGKWLRVLVDYSTQGGTISLQKRVTSGGTITTLGSYAWPGVTSSDHYAINVWYSFRLLIDELGNYWVWNYRPDLGTGIGYPLIAGQDVDLAAGGTLATGKLAFEGGYSGGALVSRGITNVFVSDYTGPQSFDFEFVPEEPTADTNQSGVVGAGLKIATLNVREPQIGTTTNAVFEFGSGSKSVSGYNRKLDREGLINEAACFPSDGSTTDIRTSRDDAAIAARGLYQEVIPSNDVSDGQLRQALADLNVQVRKQARQLITFTPGPNAPVYGTDYNVGDFVIGRGKVNGVERFNGLFRVYGVDIEIDDNGKETISPSLVPQ